MEQPDGATEANQRDEILRSFSAGGAYSKRRDLWLLVSARNSETRSRLRNDGILHLADVLQRDDFDAVECLAKVWSRSKVERESSSKALGVTVFKANEAQSSALLRRLLPAQGEQAHLHEARRRADGLRRGARRAALLGRRRGRVEARGLRGGDRGHS